MYTASSIQSCSLLMAAMSPQRMWRCLTYLREEKNKYTLAAALEMV